MKIKVLQRSKADFGATAGVAKLFRNADPALHPLERAREYQRALTATKLEKMFAKPFVKALDGHTDSVKSMFIARHESAPLVSGSCDGEIRVWNLNHLACRSIVPKAHEGFVRDITADIKGTGILSCGDDRTAKMWSLNTQTCEINSEAVATYQMATISNSIDHHWKKPMFVTTGDTVDVWDHNRSTPLSTFEWGCERVISARFNPAEPALIASTAVDRSIGLYDLRGNSAIRKVMLKMRSNNVAWNPMEPLNFTVANEDCNLYTFDMRKLNVALQRHWDHVMAVLDVAYNPNGQEFVSASYDNTVRLWSIHQSRSRDVYHAKRMQRVLSCAFSSDGRFVFSGSEDTNIRVWKRKADERLGPLTDRERHAKAYRDSLKEKFGRLPEIRRIQKHIHVPKMIKTMSKRRQVMRESRQRKEANAMKHTKPGKNKRVPMKRRQVVKELE